MSIMMRLLIFGFLVAVLSVGASGQDLGSSNKLFGGAKKKSGAVAKPAKKAAKPKRAVAKTKTSPKKAPAKPKPAVAKTETPAKTTAAKTEPSTRPAKTKPEQTSVWGNPKKPIQTKSPVSKSPKIEITPAKPKGPPVPTGAAADDLFEDLIEDGNAARDARNYLGAEDAYKRAKPLKPKDSRAVYGLGTLYSDQQRWEEAEKAYRSALQIEPGFATTQVALSYVLTQPVFAENLSERYEEAEKLARRAIQLAPSNALAFDQLGVALELRGLIEAETESAYRNAIRLNPSFAPAYAHLGRLLRRRGLTRESEASYKDAVQRSTDVATMVVVADVMQSEQRFSESEELLQNALDDDPRNPSALLLLGRALTALGKFDKAESALKKSLTISTNGFMANSLLGGLYLRQGDLQLAENALLEALRFVPSYEKRRLSQQFEAVGDGYLKTARRRFAERSYRQALELDSERESLARKLSRARFG